MVTKQKISPAEIAEMRSPLLLKLKLSLAEISELTGEALPLIRVASNKGQLRTFIVGRRRFARPADVLAWVDFMQIESDAGRPVQYQAREQACA